MFTMSCFVKNVLDLKIVIMTFVELETGLTIVSGLTKLKMHRSLKGTKKLVSCLNACEKGNE